jgi:hypothetical protein
MLFRFLADRIKAVAKRRGWSIVPTLLIVLAVVWDVLVVTHTLIWVFEKLRLPTTGWFGAVAMNHLGLVPLAIFVIGLVWFGFLVRRAGPAITITHPRNGDVVNNPITVRGTHHDQTGNYWLVTDGGNWPKRKVNFRSDGLWDEQIYTGVGKTVTISLVKVSELLQPMFQRWSRNANATRNWNNPFPLTPTVAEKNLTPIDSISVTVAKP